MALQNIGASNRDDAFYRYKMPRLVTKIEGRGNGIKTNVVNMVEVAKALERPPAYTTKFFGCELGAQSKFDDKTGTSIVNGAHETSKLAGLLEIFIKKYVQCYGCGNPETQINITKTQTIILKCAACGFVSDVDMRDKLTTFILKNPPESKKGGKEKKGLRRAEKERMKEGEVADKVKKELKKKKTQDNDKKVVRKKSGSDEDLVSQADEEDVDAGDDDGVEWQTDTSAAAAQQRIKEQLTSATSEMVMLEEDSDQSVSPSAKNGKEKENKPKFLRKSSSKKVDDDLKDTKLPKLEELSLHSVLVNDFKDCLRRGFTPSQLASHMLTKEESQPEVMAAYFEALFGGFFKGITKDIEKKKQYLAKAVTDETSQTMLLYVLETLSGSCSPEVGKEIALVLKLLYDEDILEEDQILEWFEKSDGINPKSSARKHARPFVDWLLHAESETET